MSIYMYFVSNINRASLDFFLKKSMANLAQNSYVDLYVNTFLYLLQANRVGLYILLKLKYDVCGQLGVFP